MHVVRITLQKDTPFLFISLEDGMVETVKYFFSTTTALKHFTFEEKEL